jgi:hypothetical protein
LFFVLIQARSPGRVPLAPALGDDALHALVAHGLEQGLAVIERLGDEPRAVAERERAKQFPPLAVRQRHRRLAVEREHVEDHVG